MTNYELSKDAQNDLRDIARYTVKKWGKGQLAEYRKGLKETFKAIGLNDIAARQFSVNYPQLRVTKYHLFVNRLSIETLPSNRACCDENQIPDPYRYRVRTCRRLGRHRTAQQH